MIVEDQYDMPREVEVNMVVEVRWVNRKGDLLNQAASVPVPQDLVTLERPGHARCPSTASRSPRPSCNRFRRWRRKIVSLMESPW